MLHRWPRSDFKKLFKNNHLKKNITRLVCYPVSWENVKCSCQPFHILLLKTQANVAIHFEPLAINFLA